MDDKETSVSSWISHNFLMLACTLVGLWILMKCSYNLRRRGFARFVNYWNKDISIKMMEVKKDIFSSLDSLVSYDPELRKRKAIKILEIGVGSGANFSFYPEGTHLVVVDPNPHFKTFYDENRKKFPNIHSQEIINTTGEEMDMIPDNSIDVVVTTLVLCSVKELEKFLQQVLRVLTPGGKYYFYEHIKEFDTERHATRLKIQNLLTLSGIWSFLFDGCSLTKDMLATIQQAGFAKVKAQRFYSPIDSVIFQVVEPSLKGVAEK